MSVFSAQLQASGTDCGTAVAAYLFNTTDLAWQVMSSF